MRDTIIMSAVALVTSLVLFVVWTIGTGDINIILGK